MKNHGKKSPKLSQTSFNRTVYISEVFYKVRGTLEVYSAINNKVKVVDQECKPGGVAYSVQLSLGVSLFITGLT